MIRLGISCTFDGDNNTVKKKEEKKKRRKAAKPFVLFSLCLLLFLGF